MNRTPLVLKIEGDCPECRRRTLLFPYGPAGRRLCLLCAAKHPEASHNMGIVLWGDKGELR